MMGGVHLSLLSGIILAWITTSYGISLIDTVKITECVPGKYFWRGSQPVTFYACLNNWPQRAIKMKCSEGTYMCNTGKKAFKPCECKGLKEDQPDADEELVEGNKAAIEEPKRKNDNGKFSALDFAKMSPEDVPTEGFPARGCAHNDFFELYEDSHVPGGKEIPEVTSLGQCQYECRTLVSPDCLGIDWKRNAEDGETRCWFILPQSLAKTGRGTVEGALVVNNDVDHYRVTNCFSTPVSDNLVGADVTPPTKYTGTDEPPADRRISPGDAKMAPVTTESTPGASNSNANSNANLNNGQDAGPGNRQGTVPPNMMQTTTTIPDSGCPYTFQEFPSLSHPYGKNITSGSENDEVEECKQWCLVRGYCKAVDFNSNAKTCYYLREINTLLVTSVTGVTHYRKVDCEPPRKCWAKTTTVSSEADLSITDTTTPMTDCSGYCFTRHTMTTAGQVIERGCLNTFDTAPRIGCRTEPSLMTVICYCDTPRCNGFSVGAQSAQLLYLPLDGDFMDHSGMNRDAYVAPGYSEPQFTCLDKSVNCSALFMGSQCLQVPSLAQTHYAASASSGSVPKATFSIFFKRISGSNRAQGVFGNSVDSNNATWRIQTGDPLPGYISSGLNTNLEPENNPQNLNDFLGSASDDAWHLALLTYDGDENLSQNIIPTTMFYLDGSPTPGNTILNKGNIGIRNQPVSVGCVMNQEFVGFIDEARIFNDALNIYDVRALLAMRDINFW